MALKSEPSKTVNSIGFSVKDILDLPANKKGPEDSKRNNLDNENMKNQTIDFANTAAQLAGASFFGQSIPPSFYKYGATPADLLNSSFCKFIFFQKKTSLDQ